MKKLLLAPAVAVAITGFGVAPAFSAPAGTFAATATAEAPAPQPDPAPTSDSNVLVQPEVTSADLQSTGVAVIVQNAQPGSFAMDSLTEDSPELGEVGENGIASWVIVSNSAPELGPVDFTVTYTNADGEETTVSTSFEVVESYSGETEEPTEEPPETAEPTEDPTDEATETAEPTPTDQPTETAEPTATPTDDEDDADVEYALHVDPQEISPADFVDQDKGVTLTAQGLEAGEEAEFSVAAAGSNVESLTEVVTADEDGVAQWNVYGLDASNPSAYLGDYDVTATNESDETVSGSFTVTDAAGDDSEAGEDDSDSSEDEGGSNLPRTGMELGGLAAGAALLTIGGATVLLSRRRAATA
ncbi:hypothetical protein [Brevibacterium jeotgali]|uniref:LPXTG-motif cell wall anchor domain-containing protein n=1 Tax=Brevibacterium jeotgali TaxID=1262550 RepID=A0A2H1L1E8_9MICO|nr:hypothetical protein [Brevibacterium jeotgali]TWC01918.1 hypothetical protein FB108_0576 [Brevibacterium jeotgali]SMY10731.1 hypothetical protein BJEO58_00306 [Brevibacterium jeotgali]